MGMLLEAQNNMSECYRGLKNGAKIAIGYPFLERVNTVNI
jgi:hypothetical protein